MIKKTKKTIEIESWSDTCTHCNKKIIGSTEAQCLWNLAVHIMSKHKKILKKEEKK